VQVSHLVPHERSPDGPTRHTGHRSPHGPHRARADRDTGARYLAGVHALRMSPPLIPSSAPMTCGAWKTRSRARPGRVTGGWL